MNMLTGSCSGGLRWSEGVVVAGPTPSRAGSLPQGISSAHNPPVGAGLPAKGLVKLYQYSSCTPDFIAGKPAPTGVWTPEIPCGSGLAREGASEVASIFKLYA